MNLSERRTAAIAFLTPTPDGRLPAHRQPIGPNHADLAVLQLGHAYEQACPWIGKSLPPALSAPF